MSNLSARPRRRITIAARCAAGAVSAAGRSNVSHGVWGQHFTNRSSQQSDVRILVATSNEPSALAHELAAVAVDAARARRSCAEQHP